MVASAAAVEGVAGGLGGVLSLLATYPLKTVYTHQANESREERAGPQSNTGKPSALREVLEVLRMYRLEGLYRGIGPSLIETSASSLIFFWTYALLRDIAVSWRLAASGRNAAGMDSKSVAIGPMASIGISSLAAVTQLLLTSPFQASGSG